MLLYNLVNIPSTEQKDMDASKPTHPQNSSTLSNVITLLMSSIHPWAAMPPGVCGTGVCGNEVMGVCGRLRPLVAGESNQSVQGEYKGC